MTSATSPAQLATLAKEVNNTGPTLAPEATVGLLGEIVTTLAPNVEASPAGMLMQLLAAVGNAVGRGPHMVAGGSPHHAKVNVCIVGETSKARKGTAWAHDSQVLKRADPGWAKDRIVSGLASGEGLIATMADEEDEEGQPRPRDSRLLVVEQEFARTLAACRREGSTLSAVLREAWDSGDLRVMTRSNPLRASGTHISIVGHCTIDEIQAKLTELDVANGLANRFLWGYVSRENIFPFDDEGIDALYDQFGFRLRRALSDARKVGRMERSAAGNERWAELYFEMAKDDARGFVGAMTARSEANVHRLALIYALAEGRPVVEPVDLDAAWAVWNYSRHSVAYIFGHLDTGLPVADRIVKAATERGGRIARADIYEALPGHVKASEIDAAVAVLIRDERATTEKVSTGGRPREEIVLVGAGK